MNGKKLKKRGFVMTGGGAKGLYEAGVIHAFHITGMEFDVITGSSIGAMNSVFFAEYLFHKRQLTEGDIQDPVTIVDKMENRVRSYHHAWLQMPDKRVIDDSNEGPIGQLKDDLAQFNLGLPVLANLGWWWTDPDRRTIPPPSVWPALVRLGGGLVERLGGAHEVLRILKHHRSEPVREAARTYLRRFRMDRCLIPEGEDGKLRDIFTEPVSPLHPEHLAGNTSAEFGTQNDMYRLVDPARTLRDYANEGIEVRLTRANYRTGRLEISGYVPVEDFVRFLQKQAWRIQAKGPEKLPLGSFRLQVPGNPSAVNAALCSGRFPGVFLPYPIDSIYPEDDPENELLYRFLDGWLSDPEVEAAVLPVYQQLYPGQTGTGGKWQSWCESQSMREFFPVAGDSYVDGGAIDNTPSNSAVDYVREWIEREDLSKRDVVLELFVIFLGAEPKIGAVMADEPAIFDVVGRTLNIQGVAKQTTDANTVKTINTFGSRAEQLGRTLEVVLESYRETLAGMDDGQRRQVEGKLRDLARQAEQSGYLGSSAAGILERMDNWAAKKIANDLPLHVEEIKIYPEEMPLDTLQFTERLGYRKENAIRMLTMGCYNTLWALRERLESQKQDELDELDERALLLTRKWMGEAWPASSEEREALQQTWRCQRTACIYHAQHCPHGETQKNVW